MFMPPVCWRSELTKASPIRPRPGGSLVPRAKTTSASGQLSAEATGAALGATSRTAAVASADAPRPTQRPATMAGLGTRLIFTTLPPSTATPHLVVVAVIAACTDQYGGFSNLDEQDDV